MIHGTHSLFYRVYKARYFPTCSFMEAEVGSNPSYVWHSLLSARELLREGSIWSIGDGRTVGIKSHNWRPPRPPKFRKGVDLSLKVNDFIDPYTNQWDRAKVNSWFLPQSREEVLKIHFENVEAQDKMVWNENKSNTFSVRTAYHVALRLKQGSGGEHSRARADKRVWNKLWKLPIPPKVRNFVWWATSDILPIRSGGATYNSGCS